MRRAQQVFPGDFWINHNLGMSLSDGLPSQYEEAVRFLSVAVALRPGSAVVRHNLGVSLWKKGKLDEAAAAFRKATELNPHFTTAYQFLGTVLLDNGPPDEAVAAYRRVVELEPQNASGHYTLGYALWIARRLDEAVAAYRRAIDLRPDYPEAYCNLGLALRDRGYFAQGLEALRKGHELASRRPNWRYHSAAWVKQCERLVELDGRLPAILKGEARPASVAEQCEYALVCRYKKRYVTASRLWSDAFKADPDLAANLLAGHRYNAAGAAALAAAGQGEEAAHLDERERTRWWTQALEWLRADLVTVRTALKTGKPEERLQAKRRLRYWQRDPDLAGLRDTAAVPKMPSGEKETYQQLWKEIETLLAESDAAR
jgi:tetratricopeptide (TPR) repeat protein